MYKYKFANALKWIFPVLAITGIVWTIVGSTPTNQRMPASVPSHSPHYKEAILHPFRSPAMMKHFGKLQGPLSTHINLVGPAPMNAGDQFVLDGVINSDVDVQNVQVQWHVPPNVEVLSGSLTGFVPDIKAHQAAHIQITLKALSDANAQVHLIAAASKGSVHFAESAQYNSKLKAWQPPVNKEDELKTESVDNTRENKSLSARPTRIKIYQ